MNDKERNYYNAFVAVRDFGAKNLVDFKAGSRAGITLRWSPRRTRWNRRRDANFGVGNEATARKAVALAVDDAAVGELFRMPSGNNEQNTLAAAKNARVATPIKAQFIRFGLPVDFIEDLQADVADFEQAVSGQDAVTGEKVCEIASHRQRGEKRSRRLAPPAGNCPEPIPRQSGKTRCVNECQLRGTSS